MTEEEATVTREALANLVSVVEASGVRNLADGVRLGPVVWAVKAGDAIEEAKAALARTAPPDPDILALREIVNVVRENAITRPYPPSETNIMRGDWDEPLRAALPIYRKHKGAAA